MAKRLSLEQTLSSLTLDRLGKKDNLIVWLPERRILFGGCLVRSMTWHDLGFIGDANVNSWADTVRSIQRKYSQINTVVPGHGEIGDSAILAHTIIQAEKKGL
ncbi:MAG: hypothetical protein K6L81_06130 [Agarilytica sp.]